jgi:hypothetical protein
MSTTTVISSGVMSNHGVNLSAFTPPWITFSPGSQGPLSDPLYSLQWYSVGQPLHHSAYGTLWRTYVVQSYLSGL